MQGRVRACSRSTAQQTATTAVGLEQGSDDGLDGTIGFDGQRSCAGAGRRDRNATHAITEVAAGGAIAFLESDRPDGPRVGDLHSDRAHPRDAVVLAPTSKQTRGGTVSERFCLIAAPAVDPALLLPPSAGTKWKPFPGAECEVDGWAWAIAATRRSPAAPPRRKELGRVASGRSSAVLARSRRGPASTGCTPLANGRKVSPLRQRPDLPSARSSRTVTIGWLPVRPDG